MAETQDVTDGTVAQSAREMFDRGAIGMCVLSLEGYHLHTNRTFRNMIGFTEDELKTQRWTDLVDPSGSTDVGDWSEVVIRDSIWRGELRMRARSGRIVDVLSIISLVRSPDGRPLHLLKQTLDITAHKLLEEKIHRTERIDAIGRLAAGAAHDFNNLLTSVLGEADLLIQAVEGAPWDTGGEILQGLKDLRGSAEIGAQLAKQLLNIGASRGLTDALVDVTETIEKMAPVLQRTIGKGSTLELDLCADECLALMFPDELEQVVLNLVLNASDALVEGGTIRIASARATDPRDPRTQHLPDADEVVVVNVTDEGAGIAPEVKARIFEPFFTTKPGGRGTGLGLSVVDAVVTRAGGSVLVDSEPGRGTSVTVLLPAQQRTSDED